MSRYSVLIDSSVWIEYFKTGGLNKLDRLIEEDLACINQLILTELAPSLMLQNESDIISVEEPNFFFARILISSNVL